MHRLAAPRSPQMNGRVERFNRRVNETFARLPSVNPPYRSRKCFHPAAARDAFVLWMAERYNHIPQPCLHYQTPEQMLRKFVEQNGKNEGDRTIKGG